METNIIKVGNSKGIIIPSRVMKLLGLTEKVHIAIDGKKIVITPAEKKPREGWEELIKNEVQKKGQPERLMPDVFDDEQTSEWEW